MGRRCECSAEDVSGESLVGDAALFHVETSGGLGMLVAFCFFRTYIGSSATLHAV